MSFSDELRAAQAWAKDNPSTVHKEIQPRLTDPDVPEIEEPPEPGEPASIAVSQAPFGLRQVAKKADEAGFDVHVTVCEGPWPTSKGYVRLTSWALWIQHPDTRRGWALWRQHGEGTAKPTDVKSQSATIQVDPRWVLPRSVSVTEFTDWIVGALH